MYFLGGNLVGVFVLLIILAGQIALALLVARFAVWYLTPVAYRRWKQLADEDERRGNKP
jgi:hypothetical protein